MEQLDLIDRIEKFSNFGTEPRKLVRRHDPETSIEAACGVDTAYYEKLVLEAIRSFGNAGCIMDQVLQMHQNVPYSTITARPRALLDKGLIVETGDKRPGKSGRNQRVLRAV